MSIDLGTLKTYYVNLQFTNFGGVNDIVITISEADKPSSQLNILRNSQVGKIFQVTSTTKPEQLKLTAVIKGTTTSVLIMGQMEYYVDYKEESIPKTIQLG